MYPCVTLGMLWVVKHIKIIHIPLSIDLCFDIYMYNHYYNHDNSSVKPPWIVDSRQTTHRVDQFEVL